VCWLLVRIVARACLPGWRARRRIGQAGCRPEYFIQPAGLRREEISALEWLSPAREVPQMRNYHDMGGQSAGPIDREEHPLAYWEKRVEALLSVLTAKGLTRSDEGRRALETLGAETYLNSSYAERRIQALANNMILRGVISVDELAAKLAEVERRKEQLP
jgi:hypothetical protein